MTMILNIYDESYTQYLGESDVLANVKPADYSDCLSLGEACIQMMEENATNWRNFNRALALNEAQYLMEHGKEIVYEAVDVKGLIEKGVNFIKTWLGKVLGVIQKFMAEVSAKLASATKWLGVNKKKLFSGLKFPSDKEFNDYDYVAAMKALDTKQFIGKNANSNWFMIAMDKQETEFAAGEVKKEISDAISSWCGDSNKDTCTTKDIKEYVLGKEKVKIGGGIWPSAACAKTITEFTDGIKLINKTRKEAQSVANDMIAAIKATEKTLKSNDANDDAKAVHANISIVNKINTLNNALLVAKLNIMVGNLHQAQKVARLYIAQYAKDEKDAAKNKKNETKAVNASYSFIDSLDFDFV